MPFADVLGRNAAFVVEVNADYLIGINCELVTKPGLAPIVINRQPANKAPVLAVGGEDWCNFASHRLTVIHLSCILGDRLKGPFERARDVDIYFLATVNHYAQGPTNV